MKKNNLLKVLGLVFIVFVILTWIIPTGTFSGSEFTKNGINPLGLFDLGYYPLVSVTAFMQMGIVFLTIGGLYGVLNRTGIHSKMVRVTAEKWANKKTAYLVLSIVLISLFVSLTGLYMPVMVFVPFVFAVLYRLGYSKQSSAAAVIGAIFAGVIGNTVGYHNVIINYFLGLDLIQLRPLAFKAVLYVLVTGLLILYVIRHSKNDLETVPAENRYDVLLYEKGEETTKSLTPVKVLMVLFLVFVVLSMYPWAYINQDNIFVDLYTKVMGFTIKDFPVFKNIIGSTVDPFGYWLDYQFATLLLFLSGIIGWIYGVKFDEIVKSFGEGCKKIFSVAFYACIANVIFSVMMNTTNSVGNIDFTLINYLSKIVEGFSVPVVAMMNAVSSVFFNDYNYLVYYVTTTISNIYPDATNYPLLVILTQAVYGIMMLIVPVSVYLLAGLRMFDVTYKDWFKYMWKYVLEIAVIVLVVTLIIFAI